MAVTIADALRAARLSIPLAEARLLLGFLLERNLAWIEAHHDDALSKDIAEKFSAWVNRRSSGEPVAYLTGHREFYGREFTVGPAVLIPRHETELLVELALARMKGIPAPAVLDLGTGSGCIAVTLALEAPMAKVTAVDASAEALAVARENAEALSAPVRFFHGSWFEPVVGSRFHLIVANPPYIAAGDPHLAQGDVRFEPASALASGPTGMDDIRHITSQTPDYLNPGGTLMFEHGYDQAEAVAGVLAERGFAAIEQHRDLAGILRVTLGRWQG